MIEPCTSQAAPVRFLAVSRDGVADIHELPMASALAVAAMLRERGLRIAWYPVEAPPEPPEPGPSRRDRRSARRQLVDA